MVCSLCQEDDHNKTRCPGPTWLRQKASSRFERGPSSLKGHIYMYYDPKEHNNDDSNQRRRYKIGYTVREPEERVQEQRDDTGKRFIMAMDPVSTPYARFTETILKLHLTEAGYSTPRRKAYGDGYTEWYTATKKRLIDCIEDIIEFVKGKYGNE